MRFIAHRGNLNGPNPKDENRMDYILTALEKGYDVEIDVWYQDQQWWLGHDKPQYKTGTSIFHRPGVWVHAKNYQALDKLRDIIHCNYFWHDKDDYTMTSHRYIWCLPGAEVLPHSIAVLPERKYRGDLSKAGGICSDNIVEYKKKFAVKNNFMAYMSV